MHFKAIGGAPEELFVRLLGLFLLLAFMLI